MMKGQLAGLMKQAQQMQEPQHLVEVVLVMNLSLPLQYHQYLELGLQVTATHQTHQLQHLVLQMQLHMDQK